MDVTINMRIYPQQKYTKMYTKSSFRIIENKHDLYRGNHCTKKFCEFLRKHSMKIINLNKKNEVNFKRAAGIK